MRTFKYTILLYFLFYQSCSVNSPEANLEPIEGKIFFKISEDYSSYYAVEEPKIIIRLITEKCFGCSNYSIKFSKEAVRNIININFSGIYMPSICSTSIGPATSSSFLDLSNRNYQLNFMDQINGCGSDRYTVSISDSAIKIIENTSEFTQPICKSYYRYPRNSFAYICGTIPENKWICENFLDTLLSIVNFQEFTFPDHAEIPYTTSSFDIHYNISVKYFYYEKEEDFNKTEAILKAYSNRILKYFQGSTITLTSWKNKLFRSWLLID